MAHQLRAAEPVAIASTVRSSRKSYQRAPSCQSGPASSAASSATGDEAAALDPVEAPEVAAVGHDVAAPVRRPFGLDQALLRRRSRSPRLHRPPGRVQLGEPERGPVPGHVGMVPAQPGQPAAVRARAADRRRSRGPRASTSPSCGPPVERHRHQRVDGSPSPRWSSRTASTRAARQVEHQVGVAQLRRRSRA